MSKEPTNPPQADEGQRQKTRRGLLKLGAYSIPIITTIVASGEALAICSPRKCKPKNGACPPKS
ncbi:MAG TPA: hypothetical protein VJZ02_06385 [Candidatus Brocadiales bacterium]|nr:hypothetical protein [Candidatus Brocadiales bacterium]